LDKSPPVFRTIYFDRGTGILLVREYTRLLRIWARERTDGRKVGLHRADAEKILSRGKRSLRR
jgi:hypothetical protein